MNYPITILITLCLFVAGSLTTAPAVLVAAESQIHFGDYEQKVTELRKALSRSPASAALKQNLSIALSDWAQNLILKKDTKSAEIKLQEAVSVAPQNGPAWFALGDIAYLQESNFQNAIQYWKKAQPLAPSVIQKQISERISHAELDSHLEQGYTSMSLPHFDIRFPADFTEQEVARIGKYMESEYAKLAVELKTSPEKLTLIIYQKQSFDRITGSHDETLGLYDGRIRIGVKEVHGEYESMILSHELGHAFLQHAFGNNLPIWVQEGYAQAKEPSRMLTTEQSRIEKELAAGTGWVPLKWLDRKFSQPLNLEDVSRAYLESRIVVGFLLKKGGAQAFQSFLSQISSGIDIKTAFESSFKRMSWSTVEYGRFDQ